MEREVNMSIVDQLMVLLDDQDELEINEIKKSMHGKSKQVISSSLGRLCSRGWVKKRHKKSKTFYGISSEGREEITKNLDSIRQFEKSNWDGSFLTVLFNIPEKMRKSRDVFRNELTELGFAKLQGDLWITFWDKREVVEKTISKLKIDSHTSIIRIPKLSSSDLEELLKGLDWDETELNNRYKEFISVGQKFIKTKKYGFPARCLVYEYSKILANDPIFPKEFRPKNYLGKKAYDLYSKIRPHCYKY